MSDNSNRKLSEMLWCDLRTDEERYNWLLLGRGFDTGIIARAIQNDLALAYKRLSQLQSEQAAHARYAGGGESVGCCRKSPCERPGVGPCDMPYRPAPAVPDAADSLPAAHSSWDDTYDGWGQLKREAEEQQK